MDAAEVNFKAGKRPCGCFGKLFYYLTDADGKVVVDAGFLCCFKFLLRAVFYPFASNGLVVKTDGT